MPVTIHRFTVDEYHAMGTAGIFGEDDRVELIEGQVVEMTPVGRRHAACVDRIHAWFSARLATEAIVRVQNPVRLDRHSEPEPDIALLRPREDYYASKVPGPSDTLLIVEVADTTLATDREVKLPLYREHGIGEVWIVDLTEDRLLVHRDATDDGWGEALRLGPDETVTPRAFVELAVPVGELLVP